MTVSSQPGNNKKSTDIKAKPHSGTETQTEPIMVPFPLPPIGMPEVAVKRVTIATQSDYTWMFNEFPVRTAQSSSCTSSPALTSSAEPVPVLPLRSSPKKASKKATPKTEVSPAVVEPSSQESSEPESVPQEPESPQSAAPVVAESLKSTKPPKKQKVVVPPSPASETMVETPVPIKKKPSMIEPVISDSSDFETSEVVRSLLAPKPVKLSRVITPVQVKPSAESPSEPMKQKKKPTRAPVPNSSSEDEAETPKKPIDESSSSESDADVPSVGTVLATPTQAASGLKKKKTTPISPGSPPATPTRFGPLVQVENVSPDHVEYIKTKMLEKIPENMRQGSIKSGVHDPETNRLIVQLRTHPRVAHFMSVENGLVEINSDGETRNMTVLSDGQKRKVIGLFSDDQAPPSAKRTK